MNGPTETDSVESLLPALIKMRDNALGANFDPAAAVLLSHTIAWMNWAKDNAGPINAASKMYEALKETVRWWNAQENLDSAPWIHVAKAALARADGSTCRG